MVRDVSEILKQCGWTDGFRIPVSNEENKKLENAVEDKMKKKAHLLADMEEATERLETIKKHLISADKQRKNCQELLHETRKELDSAQHFDKLCRTERDGVYKESRNVDKELQSLAETCEKLQADINRREEQIGKLRKLMRCDSAELLAWNEKHSRGEDDLQMLQTDINEDAAVYKELDIKRETLQMDVEQKRKMADKATTEVAVLEEMLDRTAQLYRQMHDERCALLKQWESSVRALHRKDQDINRTLSEIDTLRGQGRLRMAELLEAKEMLENLKLNNAETEAQIAEMQRLITALRDQDVKLQKDMDELQNELVSVKRMVVGANKRIEATRAENKRLADEKCEKKERVKALREAVVELGKRYEEASKGAMSAEQRAAQMNDLIKAEQHQYNLFNIDINRLQGTLYRMQTEFNEMENKNKLREVEIQSLKKNSVSLARTKKNLEENLFRAKEQLYTIELEEQTLKSRIMTVCGEGGPSVKQQQMKIKLHHLEETLREKKEVLNLLTTQADRLELDARQLSNLMTTTNAELTRVQNERSNLQLMVDGGKKALSSARNALNDSLIELAVFKVKKKQVANAERRESGKVFCLKKQRIEFENVAKERMLELNMHRENQMAERKTLMEDRTLILSELNQVNTKIKQYAKRYEIVSDTIGKDEYGEFISPTQLKLRMAQERILLVEEGDILDAKIRKAEKEIEAMENTLKVVNVSNENYRNRLATIDPEGPEAEELRQVEQQYLETMLDLKKSREQQIHYENRIRELQCQLQLFENQTLETMKLQQSRAVAADDLSHNLQEQDVKLHRAEAQLNRLIRDLRNRSNSTMFIMEEKDIMIRDLTDQNKSAMDQLSFIAHRFLDTGPVITRLLDERNLNLPPPKVRGQSESSHSSNSSSATSVCSSAHSSESSCTATARKLFHSSKTAGHYRGTMQTLSQLQFPMKESIVCCAPHSPITMSSETLTIPSVSVLAPPEHEEPQTTMQGVSSQSHPTGCHASAGSQSVTTVTSAASLAVSEWARRSVSRTVSISGSQASSGKSSRSQRSSKSKETESLLGSLMVESLPLTGKPLSSKTSKASVRSAEKELKTQKSILSRGGERSVSVVGPKLSFAGYQGQIVAGDVAEMVQTERVKAEKGLVAERELTEGAEMAEGSPVSREEQMESAATAEERPVAEEVPMESAETAEGSPVSREEQMESAATAEERPVAEEVPMESAATAEERPVAEEVPMESAETAEERPVAEEMPMESAETAEERLMAQEVRIESAETAERLTAGMHTERADFAEKAETGEQQAEKADTAAGSPTGEETEGS